MRPTPTTPARLHSHALGRGTRDAATPCLLQRRHEGEGRKDRLGEEGKCEIGLARITIRPRSMLHGTYCVWVQYHIVSNHFSQTRGCMARSTISIKCMQQRGKQGQERVNKRLKTMIRKTDSMTSTKFCAPNLAYWLANIGNFQPYSSRRVLPTLSRMMSVTQLRRRQKKTHRFKSLCSSFGPCGFRRRHKRKSGRAQ